LPTNSSTAIVPALLPIAVRFSGNNGALGGHTILRAHLYSLNGTQTQANKTRLPHREPVVYQIVAVTVLAVADLHR